jgi:hypothetical protein
MSRLRIAGCYDERRIEERYFAAVLALYWHGSKVGGSLPSRRTWG